jgi:hypothetical protein
MYAALEVHTTETITAGRHAVQKFSLLLQASPLIILLKGNCELNLI